MMLSRIKKVSIILLVFSHINNVVAQEIPDFYAEPGINAFRDQMNDTAGESIDPFSGTLHLVNTDLVIPGNGGLDIVVQRAYTNVQRSLGGRTPSGIGWTMHFGRVVSNGNLNLCSTSGGDISDNALFEQPDGSRQILALSATNNVSLTKERWLGGCKIDAQGNAIPEIYVVSSPTGMEYEMAESSFENGQTIRHVTRITDTNGNWLNLTYKEVGGAFTKFKVIDTITSKDARRVTYEYVDTLTDHVRLASISGAGKTWRYNYTSAEVSHYYYLTSVIRPGGKTWDYEYYTVPTGFDPGFYSMSKVTDPRGKITSYIYGSIIFDPSSPGYGATSVVTKLHLRSGGGEIARWDYSYTQDNVEDTTQITAPNGTYIFKHYGYSNATNGNLWRVGLLKEKKIIDARKGELHSEVYEWDKQLISNEANTRPTRFSNFTITDSAFYAPIMTKKTIVRDGSTYVTDYSKHDVYGNPGRIVETGNEVKQTDYTYFYNTNKWIIKQVKDETILGIGTIKRLFEYNTGNLLKESKYGVVSAYTYHLSGDIKTSTNARGFTTSFENYKRGIAQEENYPDQSTLSKVINSSGTVASVTNQRGFTTGFTYDSLNRLTSIDYPFNSDVSITYQGLRSRTLTRGSYKSIDTYDNFGRLIKIEKKDTLRGVNLVSTKKYNDVSQLVFESYPYDDYVPDPQFADGMRYKYDILNRISTVTYADGKTAETNYLSANKIKYTNERLISTLNTYRSFGNPDQKELLKTESPEDVTTEITRNLLGQITEVTQDGLSRLYEYDSHYFLISKTEPETGITELGRDAIGNMVSRKVNSTTGVQYGYDSLNRLIQIGYPGTRIQQSTTGVRTGYTVGASYTYDKNGNVKTLTSTELDNNNSFVPAFTIKRSYSYDENDNLTSESLSFGEQKYLVNYTYNELDFMSSVTYPRGNTISYDPDALGRATKALPYITGVSYFPSGKFSQLNYANGQVSQITLDDRLRPDHFQTYGVSNNVDLSYAYDPTGNVIGISDALEPQYSRGLAYDDFDRLVSASGVWGSGSVTYDAGGNIQTKTIGATSLGYNYLGNQLTSVSGTNPYSYTYDVRGNVTSNGKNQFTYDYSDRIRNVSGATSALYDYDGNGQRVRTLKDGKVSYHFYASSGNLLGDYDSSGFKYNEYMYLGSQLVATRDISLFTPTAIISGDNSAYEGEPVSLSATGSNDSDGTLTTYSWIQTAGPSVTLTNANSATPSFIAPLLDTDTVLSFELTVQDNDNLSDTTTAKLKVFNKSAPATVTQFSVTQGNGVNTIIWQATDKTESYNLYWSTSPDVSVLTGTRVTGVTLPYTHTNLNNGAPYYYIITAQNAFGESNASEVFVATPGINGVTLPEYVFTSDGEAYTVDNPQLVNNIDGTKTVYFKQLITTNLIANRVKSSTYTPGLGWSAIQDVNEFGTVDAKGVEIDANSSGNAVAAFMKEGKVSTRLYIDGQGWGKATALMDNVASFLSQPRNIKVQMSDDGSAMVVWIENQDSSYLKTSRYDPLTEIWSTPEVHDSATTYLGAELALDENGNALLVFDERGRLYVRSYDAVNDVWSVQRKLSSDARRVQFDMNDAGDAIVVWDDSGIYAQHYSFVNGWQKKEKISTTGKAPNVNIDNSGNVIVAWGDVAQNGPAIMAKHYQPVSGWESNTRIVGQGSGVTFSSDDNDNVVVAWSNHQKNPSKVNTVWANHYSAVNGWGLPVRIIQSSEVSVGGVMISDYKSDRVTISWTERDSNANQQLASSQYVYFGDGFAQQNSAPIAEAGAALTTTEQATVSLNANASFDYNDDISNYFWRQVAGPTVTLINANSATPTFIAPLVNSRASLTFELQVTDVRGAVAYDSVLTVVRDTPPPSLVTILSAPAGNIISWNEVPGADSYNLYWGTAADINKTTGTLIQNVTSAYTHTGLTEGTDYYYTLVAVNPDGESSESTPHVSKWVSSGWQNPFLLESDKRGTASQYDLAVNANGEAFAVWYVNAVNGHKWEVYSSHFDPAKGWSTPLELDQLGGLAFEPKVAINDNGDAMAIWRYQSDTNKYLYGSFYTKLNGWSTPERIETTDVLVGLTQPSIGGYQVTLDASGNAVVVWQRDNKVFSRAFINGTGWTDQIDLGAGYTPDLVMGDNDEAVIIWFSTITRTPIQINMNAIRYSAINGWSTPQTIADNAVGESPMNVASTIDKQGNISVVWEDREYSLSRVRSLRFDKASGWGAVEVISLPGNDATKPKVSSDDNGNVYAVWTWYVGPGEQNVMSSIYTPGSGWGDSLLLNPDINNANLPNISAAGDGSVMVAWVQKSLNAQSADTVYARQFINSSWLPAEKISDTETYLNYYLKPALVSDALGHVFAIWAQLDGDTNSHSSIIFNRFTESTGASTSQTPIANAGVDQLVYDGSTVSLDGSGSSDAIGTIVSYTWVQTSGPSIVLNAPNEVNASFTAPAITTDTPMTFQLTVVSDTGASQSDVVKITVRNELLTNTVAPSISAPIDVTVEASAVLTPISALVLGSATAVDDLQGALVAANNAPATFALGETTVTWRASDSAGNEGSATQTVTVVDTTAPVIIAPQDINLQIDPANPSSLSLGAASVSDLFGPVSVTTDSPNSFSFGTTVVTWTGTDANGNSGTDTQNVTLSLLDTQAPVVSAPAAITIEASNTLTPVATSLLGAGTAVDDIDGNLTVTNDAPGSFSLGTTTVTWSATDSAGNVGTSTQLVNVIDTTPPVVTAPVDITIEVDLIIPPVISLGSASVSDLFGPVSVITNMPLSFPLGTTVVTWTGTDANGNSSSDTQNVTLVLAGSDVPIVNAPAAISLEASGSLTPVLAGQLGVANAIDPTDGVLTTVSDAPASFPLGSSSVTWQATDSDGNVGTAIQQVTIVDSTQPVITVPADITVQSNNPVAIDIGSASATDIFTPVNIAHNAPALFPVGVTPVIWTATDANGNSVVATQTVTVNAIVSNAPNSAPAIGNISAAFISGTEIQLIATASDTDNGPSPLSYQWSIVSGGGSLINATSDTTVYTLPSSNVTVTFNLQVSDGQDSVETNYTLTIGSGSSNQSPTIDSLNAYFLNFNDIQLEVLASDPDDGPSPLSYNWSIDSGGGSLANPTSTTPVFTLPNFSGTQSFTFKLQVNDGNAIAQTTYTLTLTR